MKYKLKRLITLDCNEYMVLFTCQIFVNPLKQNTRPSACLKTLGSAFQMLIQAFGPLRENQKLSR